MSCTSSDLDKKDLQSYKKDTAKIVGGVAFTRLDTICDRQSDGQTEALGKIICLRSQP